MYVLNIHVCVKQKDQEAFTHAATQRLRRLAKLLISPELSVLIGFHLISHSNLTAGQPQVDLLTPQTL